MWTKKPYNELKRQNTLRKILNFFFIFFENNIRQADGKLYVSKANFQNRISTDFEHYTPSQGKPIQFSDPLLMSSLSLLEHEQRGQKQSTAQNILTPNDIQSILKPFFVFSLNKNAWIYFSQLNFKRGLLQI